ncbi:sensor histidine kinase [Caenispirillum salinarum]|nr:ATP-binding protein [Caenispirillum salinarum]
MLLVAAVLAPLAAFQALHMSEQRAILESHEHVSLDGIARHIGDRLELELTTAARLLESLSTLPQLSTPYAEGCTSALVGIHAGQPHYTNFSVVDATRHVVCSSGPLPEPVDVSGSANIQAAFATGGLGLSDFKMGLLTGKPVIVLSHPLFGPRKDAAGLDPAVEAVLTPGPVIGTLNTGLSLDWLQHVLERRPLPEGARVTVMARDGLVLASSDPERPPGFRVSLADLRLANTALALKTHPSPDHEAAGHRGEDFLSVHRVGGLPSGAMVTVERSAAAALGSVDRLAQWWLLAFAVLAAASLGTVYLIVNHLVLKRLDHLSDIARGYARGNYDGQADVWGDNSGLSALGRDLDGMAADLGTRERSLRNALEDMTRARAETARFAYIAAHDLQEPLRAIGGFTRLLEKRLGPIVAEDETAQGYMGRIVAAAERMRIMFKELMDYAVMDSGERRRESVDMETIARRAARHHPDADIRIGRLPVVAGDRRQLQRLMDQLMENAATHGREADDGKPPMIAVSALRRGAAWEISVRDDGPGIPPRDRESVFHLFKTLKGRDNSPAGSGVGLPMARRIAELHGGRMWISADTERGCDVRFTLCARPPADGSAPGSGAEAGSTSQDGVAAA